MRKALPVIALLFSGVFMIIFGSLIQNAYVQMQEYGGNYQNGILLANAMIIYGVLAILAAPIVLISNRMKLRKSYQVSLALIILGIMLSVIPMTATYGILGYEYEFTTYPLSFIGYPMIGIGVAIALYSYFTSHLKVELVQTKEGEDKTISTAKVVWGNNTKTENSHKTQNEGDLYQQLMMQHAIKLDSAESDRKVETKMQTLTKRLPSTFYCRYCGTENKNDAIYCEKCGKHIA